MEGNNYAGTSIGRSDASEVGGGKLTGNKTGGDVQQHNVNCPGAYGGELRCVGLPCHKQALEAIARRAK